MVSGSTSHLCRVDFKLQHNFRPPLRSGGPLEVRAVAVAAVILYHCDHTYIPGGFCRCRHLFRHWWLRGLVLRLAHSVLRLSILLYNRAFSRLLCTRARRAKRLAPTLAVMVPLDHPGWSSRCSPRQNFHCSKATRLNTLSASLTTSQLNNLPCGTSCVVL